MEKAVEALKKIGNDKMPEMALLQPQTSNQTDDACQHFGLFIAARMKALEPDIHLRCEMDMIKILNAATIETQERNTLHNN